MQRVFWAKFTLIKLTFIYLYKFQSTTNMIIILCKLKRKELCGGFSKSYEIKKYVCFTW